MIILDPEVKKTSVSVPTNTTLNQGIQYESLHEDVCESHHDDSILTGMYSLHTTPNYSNTIVISLIMKKYIIIPIA